jgi:hypothetical protein
MFKTCKLALQCDMLPETFLRFVLAGGVWCGHVGSSKDHTGVEDFDKWSVSILSIDATTDNPVPA